MGVHWLTAFIDHSAASAGDELRFWQVATNSALSARRGDRGQFATFVPSDGDAFLRVQETDSGDVGVHLDLHVDSVDNETIRSLRLGSTLIDRVDDGLAVMRSPRYDLLPGPAPR
ncbi:MAG: VOC family protein [Acidimicrobiales bacterium]